MRPSIGNAAARSGAEWRLLTCLVSGQARQLRTIFAACRPPALLVALCRGARQRGRPRLMSASNPSSPPLARLTDASHVPIMFSELLDIVNRRKAAMTAYNHGTSPHTLSALASFREFRTTGRLNWPMGEVFDPIHRPR